MKLACHPSTAVHPETTTDPATLRWVVSGITLPFAGLLVSAPGLDEFLNQVRVEATVGAGHMGTHRCRIPDCLNHSLGTHR